MVTFVHYNQDRIELNATGMREAETNYESTIKVIQPDRQT